MFFISNYVYTVIILVYILRLYEYVFSLNSAQELKLPVICSTNFYVDSVYIYLYIYLTSSTDSVGIRKLHGMVTQILCLKRYSTL